MPATFVVELVQGGLMAEIDLGYLAQEERAAHTEARQGLLLHALAFTALSIVLIAINVSVRDLPWAALAIAVLALGLYLHWFYGLRLSGEKLHHLVGQGRARAPGSCPNRNGARAGGDPPGRIEHHQATTAAGLLGDHPPRTVLPEDPDGVAAVVPAGDMVPPGAAVGRVAVAPQVGQVPADGIALTLRWAQLDMRQAVVVHGVALVAFSLVFLAMNTWTGGAPWAVFPIAFMAVGLFLHWLYGTRLGVAGLLRHVQRVQAQAGIDHATPENAPASGVHPGILDHRQLGTEPEEAR